MLQLSTTAPITSAFVMPLHPCACHHLVSAQLRPCKVWLAVSVPLNNDGQQNGENAQADEHQHYSQRATWLRASVLGANDGLVTVGALMTGIGSASQDQHQLLLSAVSALVAGVRHCRMQCLLGRAGMLSATHKRHPVYLHRKHVQQLSCARTAGNARG